MKRQRHSERGRKGKERRKEAGKKGESGQEQQRWHEISDTWKDCQKDTLTYRNKKQSVKREKKWDEGLSKG